MRILATTAAMALIPAMLSAQPRSWQAAPEIVKQREEQRPNAQWRESEVQAIDLPDPLRVSEAKVVRAAEEWRERREAVLELFRVHMYGRSPGLPEELSFETLEENPQAMDGAATLRRIEIRSRQADRSHTFELILYLPNQMEESVPVFLLINNRGIEVTDPTRERKSDFWPAESVIARGYGIAAIQNGDLAPDDAEHYHQGVIRLFEGDAASGTRPPDAWAALAAWGWGASRAMDYLETESRVDASKVAVLGHSRAGKAALWAAAEDERFALVISNESGCGGAALSRRKFGETVSVINDVFPHWFAANFRAFNDAEESLPFDQHMLISLIAPRAVYVGSADEDLWADPRGEFLSLAHASSVYGLWGYEPIPPDGMPPLERQLVAGPRGYHIRSGGHDLTPSDWHRFLNFAELWQWNVAK